MSDLIKLWQEVGTEEFCRKYGKYVPYDKTDLRGAMQQAIMWIDIVGDLMGDLVDGN